MHKVHPAAWAERSGPRVFDSDLSHTSEGNTMGQVVIVTMFLSQVCLKAIFEDDFTPVEIEVGSG